MFTGKYLVLWLSQQQFLDTIVARSKMKTLNEPAILSFLKLNSTTLKHPGRTIQGRENPQISFVPLVSVFTLTILVVYSKNFPYSTFWWKYFYVVRAGQ